MRSAASLDASLGLRSDRGGRYYLLGVDIATVVPEPRGGAEYARFGGTA
jgi:hypothetical protein